MPIILVHTPFWRGLVDWLRDRLVAEHMIALGDVDLVTGRRAAARGRRDIRLLRKRGFPSAEAKRESMLTL
jgi:hypothetical protein